MSKAAAERPQGDTLYRPLVCPECGRLLLKERMSGRLEVRCPRCKALVEVQTGPNGGKRRVAVL